MANEETHGEQSSESGQTTGIAMAMTYSAYREMEMVPASIADTLSTAILSLADDPRPDGVVRLDDNRGCYYLPVRGWYVLYHLSLDQDSLTVLGVLDGPYHTVH
jgi:hypothetical protein